MAAHWKGAPGEMDQSAGTDGRPTAQEGGARTVQPLAGGAMAVLGIQGLLPAQLVLDSAAMAATLVADIEVWVVLVQLVRRAIFPIVETHSVCGLVLGCEHTSSWSSKASGDELCSKDARSGREESVLVDALVGGQSHAHPSVVGARKGGRGHDAGRGLSKIPMS